MPAEPLNSPPFEQMHIGRVPPPGP